MLVVLELFFVLFHVRYLSSANNPMMSGPANTIGVLPSGKRLDYYESKYKKVSTRR